MSRARGERRAPSRVEVAWLETLGRRWLCWSKSELVCLLVPRRLHLLEELWTTRLPVVTRESMSPGTSGLLFSPSRGTSTSGFLGIFSFAGACRVFALAFLQQSTSCSSNAATRRQYEIIALLLICLAIGAPPRPKAAVTHSACNCLLSPRALSSMRRDSARDAAQYRGTPGGHTLSVRTYSAKPIRQPPLVARAATFHMKFERSLKHIDRTAPRSRRPATSPNERSLETHQPYRAQAPTAMAT